ncbi:hypothetical protein ABZ330_16640 [Streptomyces sp. NPDC006172]|uniref:hypothetical protein n=1 Tax=Streptomyces sp. NPDC006172 TaxID=3154470 RepID=UPI0033FF03C2
MSEYAFDAVLNSVIRINADTYEEAERMARDVIAVDVHAWIGEGRTTVLTEISVEAVDLFEIDNEPAGNGV